MANPKRNVEIYRKHKQGIKTGVLIRTYNLSRQRLHQIFKQEKLKEEKLKEEYAKDILEKEERFNKMKEAKLCGTCYFYDSNGFCDNAKSPRLFFLSINHQHSIFFARQESNSCQVPQ